MYVVTAPARYTIKRRQYCIKVPAQIQALRIFQRYKRVAFSAAKRVTEKTGRFYHEMADVAIEKLGSLASTWAKKFDRSQSQACTYVYSQCYWACMVDVAFKNRKREVDLPEGDEAPFIARMPWLESFMQELSDEGRALVRIVLEAPAGLSSVFTKSPTAEARLALMEHLRRRSWSEEQIDVAWTEIQENLECL